MKKILVIYLKAGARRDGRGCGYKRDDLSPNGQSTSLSVQASHSQISEMGENVVKSCG